MKKWLSLVLLIWLGAAFAQVEVDISPDDLLAGTADETLQQLGARAAAEGMQVTVTSPPYWTDLIVEQIQAGAGEVELSIAHREIFVESVIVRLADAGSSASSPARAPVEAPAEIAAAPSPAPAQPADPSPTRQVEPAPADPPEAVAERPGNEPEAPAESAAISEEPLTVAIDQEVASAPTGQDVDGEAPDPGPIEEPAAVAEEPAVQTTAATPPPPADTAAAEETSSDIIVEVPVQAPQPGDSIAGVDSLDEVVEEPEPQLVEVETDLDEIAEDQADDVGIMSEAEARASLERRLNDGRPIGNALSTSQLRRGDQVFVTGEARAIVRGTRLGRNVFWLDGPFDPEHRNVRRERAGKYEITGRIDTPQAAVAEQAPDTDPALAQIAGDERSDERSEMEARYNQGRPIESTLSPSGLLPGDMLYVGDNLIVVVRRDKVSLKRFWLVGDLDLEASELEMTGARKYRVKRRPR